MSKHGKMEFVNGILTWVPTATAPKPPKTTGNAFLDSTGALAPSVATSAQQAIKSAVEPAPPKAGAANNSPPKWRCYKSGDLNPQLNSFSSLDLMSDPQLASYGSNPLASIGESLGRTIKPDVTRGTKSSAIRAVVLGSYIVEGQEAQSYNMNVEPAAAGALANRAQVVYIRVPELTCLTDPYCNDNSFTAAQVLALVEMHPRATIPNWSSTQPSIIPGTLVEVEFIQGYSSAIVKRILGEATSLQLSNQMASAKNAGGAGTYLGATGRARKNSCPVSNLRDGVIRVAKKFNIAPEAIETIRRVESGSDPSVLRFEPHVFKRYRSDLVDTNTAYAGYTPTAGRPVPYTPGRVYCPPKRKGKCVSTVSYVGSETNRSAFIRAFNVDKMNAILSTSFGYFQVIPTKSEVQKISGKTGDAAAQEFYNLSKKKAEFLSFELLSAWLERSPSAVTAARSKDWLAFTLKYNGKSAAKQGYPDTFQKTYDYLISQRCDLGSIA